MINNESSLQLVAIKLHNRESSLEETLLWMKDKGSSVDLNYGEDTDAWECSWITGGERYTGVNKEIRLSVLGSLNKCFAACVERDYPESHQWRDKSIPLRN